MVGGGGGFCLLKGVRFYTELIDVIMCSVQHTDSSTALKNVNMRMGREIKKKTRGTYNLATQEVTF